jgi:hypothetical protein
LRRENRIGFGTSQMGSPVIKFPSLRIGWHKLMATASDGLLAFNTLGLLHCSSTIADAIDVALKKFYFLLYGLLMFILLFLFIIHI